jgi:hypothetical protein
MNPSVRSWLERNKYFEEKSFNEHESARHHQVSRHIMSIVFFWVYRVINVSTYNEQLVIDNIATGAVYQ